MSKYKHPYMISKYNSIYKTGKIRFESGTIQSNFRFKIMNLTTHLMTTFSTWWFLIRRHILVENIASIELQYAALPPGLLEAPFGPSQRWLALNISQYNVHVNSNFNCIVERFCIILICKLASCRSNSLLVFILTGLTLRTAGFIESLLPGSWSVIKMMFFFWSFNLF